MIFCFGVISKKKKMWVETKVKHVQCIIVLKYQITYHLLITEIK